MARFNVDLFSSAERLLWSYGVEAAEHIDLDAIAYDLNVKVVYRQLDGCEARLVAHNDRAIISINKAGSRGRRRFSLGHELAHWVCDRAKGSFLCADDDVRPQNIEAKHVESMANIYSSQLVLPDYLVNPWASGKILRLETASWLKEEFRSSLTPAAIKLVRKSNVPACVACHSQTKLCWFQKNLSFPSDIYLNHELHQDTDAFGMVYGTSSGLTRQKKEPADRWLRGSGIYKSEVLSQSVKLPDGTVLTMLVLADGRSIPAS